MINRRISRPLFFGKLQIGGGAPVAVQTMTKTDTHDVRATVDQIKELEEAGCEIIRIAVPDIDAANAIKTIIKNVTIPIIADIHYDYRLALAALDAGVNGLRLNPGNIGDPEKVRVIVKRAKEFRVPIRIGVNAGSLPENFYPDKPLAQRMVEAAINHIKILENMEFNLIKVSLKAFDVPTTIQAYRDISSKIPYPLHIGITESGTPRQGMIRSAVGIGILLSEGIGDTIRVSLTGNPLDEIYAGYEILKSLNMRDHGPILVSCPTCGRTEIDIISLANAVEQKLLKINKPIKVAVMGCVVNGPGEAKEADIGIAGGKGKAVLFKKGQRIRVVNEKDILHELFNEIEKM